MRRRKIRERERERKKNLNEIYFLNNALKTLVVAVAMSLQPRAFNNSKTIYI